MRRGRMRAAVCVLRALPVSFIASSRATVAFFGRQRVARPRPVLRMRPETVSPSCAEQWTVMPGGIFFQCSQFSTVGLSCS